MVTAYAFNEGTTLKATQKNLAKARRRTSLGSLAKFAEKVDGEYRIVQQPPVIVKPPDDQEQAAEDLVKQGLIDYAQTLTPIAAWSSTTTTTRISRGRSSGSARSAPRRSWCLLMGDRDDDPLFLQVKEANASVLAAVRRDSEYDHHGERVVQGQRLMQAASDAFLGWVTGAGVLHRRFYVRQLRDMKGSAVIETMAPQVLARYGEICGGALARAHARSGDAAKIAGYLGDEDTFDRALEAFASAYADQNEADYGAFTYAADEGLIAVERGV